MPRKEYDVKEQAFKVLSKLSKEQLESKEKIWEVLDSKNIELSPQAMGKIRKQLLGSPEDSSATANQHDLLANIGVVSKAAKRVGGLQELKTTIQYIEKVRNIL